MFLQSVYLLLLNTSVHRFTASLKVVTDSNSQGTGLPLLKQSSYWYVLDPTPLYFIPPGFQWFLRSGVSMPSLVPSIIR